MMDPEAILQANQLSWPGVQRLMAAGVDKALLPRLTACGLLGACNVELDRDGARWVPGGFTPRLLLGVTDSHDDVIDVVAMSTTCEDEWALLTGRADMLGEDVLEHAIATSVPRQPSGDGNGPQARKRDRAPELLRGKPSRADALRPAHEGPRKHVRLYSTPMDWLRAGGEGVCVLTWDKPALSALRGLPQSCTIICDAGGRERLRGMLAYGGLPLVAEDGPNLGRVA